MEKQIGSTTGHIIRQLYGEGNINKAALAGFRNANSITEPRAQAVWPIIFGNFKKEWLSWSGKPTRAETAIYAAVRFYAIHQQGLTNFVYGSSYDKDDNGGLPLFLALAKLRQNPENQVALDRRVQNLLGTTNFASALNSLNHIVPILKQTNNTQKIDYASLASDLYRYQIGYEPANSIRLIWGQQYYRDLQLKAENEGKQTK